jgi:hypothetical protein
LTLLPSLSLLDPLFLRIILLLAGSSLEHLINSLSTDPSYVPPPPQTPRTARNMGLGGTVTGVVASKRNRGDRIEVWLGGERKGEAPNTEWIERCKEAFARCGVEEMRSVKYKKHFGG